MPHITAEEVKKVSRLARLQLSEQEIQLFTQQLGTILDYVQQLQRLPTDAVPPTSHVLPLVNVLRADEMQPCLEAEQVSAMAPARKGRFVQVPKVIETEPA